MKIILANLFLFMSFLIFYYFDVFSMLSSKYLSWFAVGLVVSVFVVAFKIIGSPFDALGDDDDDISNVRDDTDPEPRKKK